MELGNPYNNDVMQQLLNEFRLLRESMQGQKTVNEQIREFLKKLANKDYELLKVFCTKHSKQPNMSDPLNPQKAPDGCLFLEVSRPFIHLDAFYVTNLSDDGGTRDAIYDKNLGFRFNNDATFLQDHPIIYAATNARLVSLHNDAGKFEVPDLRPDPYRNTDTLLTDKHVQFCWIYQYIG